ncbi:MAG: DUF6152 family protein [Rhodovibrionaceae bacterium]
MRKILLAALAACALTFQAGAALAHHGWAWTTGGNIEVTGIITSAKLGNPHGVLTLDVEGETWTAEVGQPWRNERAGVKEGDLAEGVEIRIIGEPSANIEDKRVKAERFYIGEREFILYPERK